MMKTRWNLLPPHLLGGNISYNTGLLPPGLLGISEKGSGQLASW